MALSCGDVISLVWLKLMWSRQSWQISYSYECEVCSIKESGFRNMSFLDGRLFRLGKRLYHESYEQDVRSHRCGNDVNRDSLKVNTDLYGSIFQNLPINNLKFLKEI